jgi:hypothetical protein
MATFTATKGRPGGELLPPTNPYATLRHHPAPHAPIAVFSAAVGVVAGSHRAAPRAVHGVCHAPPPLPSQGSTHEHTPARLAGVTPARLAGHAASTGPGNALEARGKQTAPARGGVLTTAGWEPLESR